MRFISELGLQTQVYRTLHCTPGTISGKESKYGFFTKINEIFETSQDYRSPSPVGFHPGAVVHNWRYGITRACINLECPVAKKVICEKDLQAIRAVALGLKRELLNAINNLV